MMDDIDKLSMFHVSAKFRALGPEFGGVTDLTYEEIPVQILDRKEQTLRNKTIYSFKVLWRNHAVEEATWELEDKIKTNYPHLFV